MCLYLHHQRLGSLPKVDELREIYESQFKEGREILEKFISEKGEPKKSCGSNEPTVIG